MFAGEGDCKASKSWWPTDSNWQANAPYTRWTERFDADFEAWLKKIQAGDAEPLNYDEWRQKIRGTSTIRRVNKSVTGAFGDFVKTHLST
jgi:hypothetical protein